MTKLFLAAALAAIALPLPATSFAKQVSAHQIQVGDHPHLRTTLHGQKGPVVVLIPGLSSPAAAWGDMAAKLSPDHRVLVVEVKGFDGTRAEPNEKAGMLDGIVADLANDLHARGFGQPVIVGHSLGGLLAMKFALAHPNAAKSIVIVDSLPFFGTVFDPNATLATIEPRAKQMRDMMIGQAETIRAMGAKGVSADPGGIMSVNPATRIQVSNWSMKAEPLAVAQAMYEDMMADLRGDIAGIKIPVTVLYNSFGDGTAARTRYATDYAAKTDALLVPVQNTGHFIQLDQPAEVEKAIRSAAR